ncbi:MAG TPA: hypothetical protein DCE75_13595, partial [Acidimicrobiaceae bacterium]|nr:hypothetical protein [Acidimicrobiaceae bacterium]
ELDGYARRYLGIFGDEAAVMMASMCSSAGPEATLACIERCQATGMDELYLVPTSPDPDRLSELIDLIT